MIKKKSKMQNQRIQIDLTGPDGNAYVLIGYARDLARQIGKDPEAITKDMMSSDYEHLLKIFEKHFGSFVDLYR